MTDDQKPAKGRQAERKYFARVRRLMLDVIAAAGTEGVEAEALFPIAEWRSESWARKALTVIRRDGLAACVHVGWCARWCLPEHEPALLARMAAEQKAAHAAKAAQRKAESARKEAERRERLAAAKRAAQEAEAAKLDDGRDCWPIQRAVISANEAAPIQCSAPRSVFEWRPAA